MTITEFLLARIAGDEAVARAAAPGPWSVSDGNEGEWPPRPLWMVTNDAFHNPTGDDAPYIGAELHAGVMEDAEHIARHDPARVLAECAAKRAVIEEVSTWGHHYNDDDLWYSCGLATSYYEDEPGSGCSNDSDRGRCTCGLEQRVLRILGPLADVYADHPDYQPEWAL